MWGAWDRKHWKATSLPRVFKSGISRNNSSHYSYRHCLATLMLCVTGLEISYLARSTITNFSLQIPPPWIPLESSNHTHPIIGLVSSYTSNRWYNVKQRKTVLSLTATPLEMNRLRDLIQEIETYEPYRIFDAIHISIPNSSIRFPNNKYPSTKKLQEMFSESSRIVLHRLRDFGPLTRYVGPISFEQHPETLIVIIDVDSQNMDWQHRGSSYGVSHKSVRDLVQLVQASQKFDAEAMWCTQGEDFVIDKNGVVSATWDTFPLHVEETGYSWNEAHFCRGVGGLLFKPKHFSGFWYNQTSYHESCFLDDDRWVGFQMERLGIPVKVLHSPSKEVVKGNHRRLGALSKLTALNAQLRSDQTCTLAWIKDRPESFPSARGWST